MSKLIKDQSREVIHSRLRMVSNGTTTVNSVRAEHVGGICVSSEKVLKSRDIHVLRGEDAKSWRDEKVVKNLKRGSQEHLPRNIRANVFVTFKDSAERAFTGKTAQCGRYATAEIALSQLDDLAGLKEVSSVELGESIKTPMHSVGLSSTRFPDSETDREIEMTDTFVGDHKGGAGVLIGIIDVQGFDFAHQEFLDESGDRTRFVRIWDQGGDWRNPPGRTGTFNYGAEFSADNRNDAIKDSDSLGAPATEIERQSQMVSGSHGTHVASIAAGNHGVCPQAKIAAVLLSLPSEDNDRRLSFYDTTRLVHAVDYLLKVAAEEDCEAISLNISLGTNGGAHDASEAMSRWIDNHLTVPGRSVAVAAGNAGQDQPMHSGDIGFLMGRIHTSGTIEAKGLSRDLEWIVVGNGIEDLSENELEIWYDAGDRFSVMLKPPGHDWIGPVKPGEYIENRVLEVDKTVISIYNELYNGANGDNKISIYLSPFLSNTAVLGVTAGQWIVRLVGRDVRNGKFDGWIERDDPRPLQQGPNPVFWRFPSFFAAGSNVDNSSVSSLACGPRVLSVANLDKLSAAINVSSSQGPTRDGRQKPDIAAPGTDILAANGFNPDQPWVRMTGTSMAAPYVCGVAGLMLATNPALNAAQIRGIMQRTAIPLPGDNYAWRNGAGFGVIDPAGCVEEAEHAKLKYRKDIT